MKATCVLVSFVMTFSRIVGFGQGAAPTQATKPPLDKALAQESASVPKPPERLATDPPQASPMGGVRDDSNGQRFFCKTGYALSNCLEEIAVAKVGGKVSDETAKPMELDSRAIGRLEGTPGIARNVSEQPGVQVSGAKKDFR